MKANYKPKYNCGVSLYDINKNMYINIPPIDDEHIEEEKVKIHSFAYNSGNQYYMLLCKDISYYTLFNRTINSKEKFEDVVIECLKNNGDIIDIIYNNEESIEFWLRQNEEVKCFYLFPYDLGVIEVY